MQGRWILAGDINAILLSQDRRKQNAFDYNLNCELALLVNKLHLGDIRANGCVFTRCNRHERALTRVYSKIDGIQGNVDWLLCYPMAEVKFKPAGVSDNYPSCLPLEKDHNGGISHHIFFYCLH